MKTYFFHAKMTYRLYHELHNLKVKVVFKFYNLKVKNYFQIMKCIQNIYKKKLLNYII